MEFLIVIAICMGLLFLMGVQWQWILLGVLLLLGLLMVLLAVLFLGMACFLFLFRRKRGRFLRFAQVKHFEVAVYTVDGQDYQNCFPAERLLRNRIYPAKEQTLLVRRFGTHYLAFDRHSLLIEAIGLVASLAGLYALLMMMPQLIF